MKIDNLNVLIGSDPELFVHDGRKFVSGHNLIEGTKEEPFPVRGGAIQVDGVALEFNTNPARGAKEFSNTVDKVLAELANKIPDHLRLVANPTADFAAKYFNALPAKAKELGCDPDFNAYSGEANPRPNADVTFRTGAGHIHVGWTDVEDPLDPVHMDECRAIVQALDIFLGVPSTYLDGDKKRRELYGKAGAFRPKTYGVEYRTLSNFWVMDDKLRQWVFNNTMKALKGLLREERPLGKHYNYAIRAINAGEHAYGNWVMETFNVPMPEGQPWDDFKRERGIY
jgi:hypothetical protein